MVALVAFPITTFPELLGHYQDMRQVQTFRTLIPAIHHQCIKLPRNRNLYESK